ncbi:MAG: hypothetical protein KDC43_18710, partial [Saprospiraceae bacterium]|nr:hypothetical protein [Saprospiraceae bacterium]
MKNNLIRACLFALLAVGMSTTAWAQYDDLYYDPNQDSDYYNSTSNTYSNDYGNDYDSYSGNDYDYDDDGYEYFDEYDYYYSSRIRRFHRPYYGFNYYDPVYVDMFYYDPFFNPGMTVLIYDDYWSYRSWSRWNRWNRWSYGPGWNVSFGWGSPGFGFGWGYNNYNSWYNPWYNSYYDPYWGSNYYSSFYCPPSWGNGYVYNTVNNNNYYYGARRTGTSKVPRETVRPSTIPNNGVRPADTKDGGVLGRNPRTDTELADPRAPKQDRINVSPTDQPTRTTQPNNRQPADLGRDPFAEPDRSRQPNTRTQPEQDRTAPTRDRNVDRNPSPNRDYFNRNDRSRPNTNNRGNSGIDR